MKFEINSSFTGKVLFELECGSLKICLEKAVEAKVDLSGANLAGASLYGATLSGANLYGANLDGANLYGANLSRANLAGARLYGATLDGANLYGANLSHANLSRATLAGATLYGVPWEKYLSEAVPALLTAGGKTVKEILDAGAWECHDWDNCPMKVAFGIDKPEDGPALLVPAIRQFVKLFDAGAIPKPVVVEDSKPDSKESAGA